MMPIVDLRNHVSTNNAKILVPYLVLADKMHCVSRSITIEFVPVFPILLVILVSNVNVSFHHLNVRPIHNVHKSTCVKINVAYVRILFYHCFYFINDDCFPSDGCRSSFNCPSDKTCINEKCLSPCVQSGACGANALCTSSNHVAVCNCPSGFRGDPLSECKGSFFLSVRIQLNHFDSNNFILLQRYHQNVDQTMIVVWNESV